MGASDLNNGSVDLDSARLERSTRVNQPDYAPGQGDNDLFSNDSIGVSSTPQPNSLNLGGVFTPNTANVYGVNPAVQQQQPTVPQKSEEEVFWDILSKACKAIGSGIKKGFLSLASSREEWCHKFYAHYGSVLCLSSVVLGLVGLALLLLSSFGLGLTELGFNLLIGSILSLIVGVMLVMFNTEAAKSESGIEESVDIPAVEDYSSTVQFEDSDYESDSYDDDDDFNYEDDEDLDLFSNVSAVQSEGMDAETALETLQEVPMGMYTRQYLYEAFTKVLSTIKPDYDTVRTFDEDSDTFVTWEQYLRDSAEVVGTKYEDLPELLELSETALTIRIVCTRPRNFKHEAVASELASIYAHASGTKDPNVYAISETIGKECHFTVFTGSKLMVSLKDMYCHCEDFVLNTKNYMPIVIGIDHEGKIIKADFKKIESILVTGMPRKGKSWVVQLILTQMCAYLSPKELHLYILDPKEGISDYRKFVLPHVKKFVSGDDNIVSTLRRVVREEAPRRKKILGDADCVNIWDYKELYPDVDLPVIYVVIDEVVTLAERMDKETKAEFQGYLVELISQLPALGIRAFMIPHVVKNDIIAKTATDLIPCRISVCGDAAHIESSTGTKPKDFNFKLSAVGDMALKVSEISPSTLFVHAGVLSDSNPKNNKIFDYLRRVWLRLEPDCNDEKVHIVARNEKELRELCSSFDVNESDMLGYDDINLF